MSDVRSVRMRQKYIPSLAGGTPGNYLFVVHVDFEVKIPMLDVAAIEKPSSANIAAHITTDALG